MTNPTKIFISYARKDGRDLALKLKDSLELAGYDVWLDTSEIEGGDSWGKTIEEAIDARDAVLALMSPASYLSEICRAEQLRALRKKKHVIPIRVSEKADIPIWLEPLNYRDFSKAGDYDTAFAQVLADLGNTSYKPPVIYDIFNNAPALPPHFIPRPEEFNKLKDALLSDTTDRQVALTALRGLGGIGKSVMANGVCRDEFVSGAFPDGVFWVELGREPQDITGKLAVVGQGLGDKAGNYATQDNAISSLRNILKHKSALIVLDDVWAESLKVAQYFIGTSPRTRWLITTRDQKIVESLDATPIELGMMTPAQALALMREWAGRNDDLFPSIAEKLGYHPLGLKIVGARLRDMTSEEWVKNYDITRIKMGYSAKKTDDNLVVCFQVSVDSLSEELPSLYHALGIFPEDVWIPESMVTILWRALNPQLSSADCTDISIELAKLALIDRQRDKKQIRMHDLLHDYNRYKIREYDAELQSAFVTALGDPYTLPHVYTWRYYAYHLAGASRLAELRPLLLSYRWLEAKLHATDTKSLLEDCDLWLSRDVDETIRLIRSALSNSVHVTDVDKSALAHQLAGRLMHHYKLVDEIQVFWDSIVPPRNSLYPMMSEYDPLNPAGGMLLRTIKHEGAVYGATQLHSGHILSWGWNNVLKLWQADGSFMMTLSGHENSVYGAIELSDGRILSRGYYNLRLWVENGTSATTLQGHTDRVMGIWELSSRKILSWSLDKTLRLWEIDGTPITVLIGHKSGVNGAIELSDGRILSWGQDGALRLWWSDGIPITALIGHKSGVNGAIELSDGRILSWAGNKYYEGTDNLRLWQSDGTPITTLTGHTGYVVAASELADGRILSWAGSELGNENTFLRLWQSDGTPIMTLTGHTASVNGVCMLGDGRILSWSNDNTLRLWQSDGTPIMTLTGHTHEVDGVIILNDGRILSWSRDSTLRLWDDVGTLVTTFTAHTNYTSVKKLSDGRILSWGDNNLRLWESDGKSIMSLIGHTDFVTGAYELSDKRILSWSFDRTRRLWNSDGTPITILNGYMTLLRGIRELPDGRILSWSDDSIIRLWSHDNMLIDSIMTKHDQENLQQTRIWVDKHGLLINDIQPPEQEDSLMLGGYVKTADTNLIIYDQQTGGVIHTFYGDALFLPYPVVTENGNVVVAGDSAGRVLFLRWIGDDNTLTTTPQ